MISELKLNDYLKKDGQNCCALLLGLRNAYLKAEKDGVVKGCALLLGLRNAYHLHQNLLIANGLQIKSMAIFFLYPLTVAGTCGFSAESKRLLLATLNHTSNGILHYFYGKSL